MAKRACKVLRYVLCNFYAYYYLLDFVSSGLQNAKCPILAKNSAFHENIAVRNGQNRHQRLHLWPKVLLNCSDMSYATFIPTIVSSVLPLAASRTPRMRKSSNFDRKPAFDENIAVRNASKQPERLHLWSKMRVNCSDVFYATFICTIVYSVLPLAASRMRKCRILAENSVFYENISR